MMRGQENFHPAGSYNGWMTSSDCIVDKPPMMLTVRFSFRYFE
jgi:hypothetical protein